MLLFFSETLVLIIQPENIGFDIRGDIKIFDFGLSKELPTTGADGNDAYQMTGMVSKIVTIAWGASQCCGAGITCGYESIMDFLAPIIIL